MTAAASHYLWAPHEVTALALGGARQMAAGGREVTPSSCRSTDGPINLSSHADGTIVSEARRRLAGGGGGGKLCSGVSRPVPKRGEIDQWTARELENVFRDSLMPGADLGWAELRVASARILLCTLLLTP